MATPRNQSVFRAFALLRSFQRPDECLSSLELSQRAKLPEASGHRLIKTLEELGAIRRSANGRYRPSMLLLALSSNVVVAGLLREVMEKEIDKLARELDVTMHVGILEDKMVTYVTRVLTSTSFDPHTRCGAQIETYRSALDKVLLATLTDEQIDSLVVEYDQSTPILHIITDPIILVGGHLDDARRQDLAVSDREGRTDMRFVAVPIRDREGHTIAAVSATQQADGMTPARLEQLRAALSDFSAVATNKIYPIAPPLRLRSDVKLTRRDRGRPMLLD